MVFVFVQSRLAGSPTPLSATVSVYVAPSFFAETAISHPPAPEQGRLVGKAYLKALELFINGYVLDHGDLHPCEVFYIF
jgi:hypothetical protein